VRTEVRGTITLNATSGVPCSLSTSLETYDTTSGVTHMYLSTGDVNGEIGGDIGGIGVGPGH
jgi:hypothetical protein